MGGGERQNVSNSSKDFEKYFFHFMLCAFEQTKLSLGLCSLNYYINIYIKVAGLHVTGAP